MKSFFLLVLFGFFSASVHAQGNVTDELKFYDYLLQNKLMHDAALQYNLIIKSPDVSIAQNDSLNYLTGWNLYQQKLLDTSIVHFLKVNASSPYYLKSRFFSAYNLSYLHRLDTALFILNGIQQTGMQGFAQLLNLQKAGIALLNSDGLAFEAASKKFDGSYFATAKEEEKLKTLNLALKTEKKKSPLAAALLSSIIPGLGKIYAGRTGEGVISFVQVSALGCIAVESLNKSGVKSGRFIITASLFSLFYIGNIWGSYFTVSVEKNERRNEIYNAVLFNMHIPLRTVFN